MGASGYATPLNSALYSALYNRFLYNLPLFQPPMFFFLARLRANTINCNIDKIHERHAFAHGSREEHTYTPSILANPPFYFSSIAALCPPLFFLANPMPPPCRIHSLIRCPHFMGAASFRA